jgi:hypothetical protein
MPISGLRDPLTLLAKLGGTPGSSLGPQGQMGRQKGPIALNPVRYESHYLTVLANVGQRMITTDPNLKAADVLAALTRRWQPSKDNAAKSPLRKGVASAPTLLGFCCIARKFL